MFWTIVLFALILFFSMILRGFNAKAKSEDMVVYVLMLNFVFWLGSFFFVPFAIKWTLSFLLNYEMGYWLIFGLHFAYKILLMPIKKE